MNNGNTKVKCGYGVPISNPVTRKISHLEAETITKHRKCENFLATGLYAVTSFYFSIQNLCDLSGDNIWNNDKLDAGEYV